MDFFDPHKQKQHARRLAIGYAVIGAVLILATTILIHLAYGYGVDKEGRIIQNGLLFVSSQPREADIYLSGKKVDTTNTRMALPSGQYLMELKREGYFGWKRILTVEGGSVERFDYPLLIPKQLKTETIGAYTAAPRLSTVSPDGRWLLVATAEESTFDLFDLNAKQPKAETLIVPDDILAASSKTTGWSLVEWSKDNRHALLLRSYESPGQKKSEYIMLDREEPASSQNLSVTLGFTPDKIELRDHVFDKYYLYDKNNAQLFTASLDQPTPQPFISGVLAFSSNKDSVVYVTTKGASEGKVMVKLKNGSADALNIKQLPEGPSYLLDLTVYNRKLYLAAGAVSDSRVFLYGDPADKLKKHPTDPLVPLQILKVNKPARLTFSPDSRFVVAENGPNLASYDIETDRGFVYQTDMPVDAPQKAANWIDDFRLSYVSGGTVVVFDFDGTNLQKLSTASPAYQPVFDQDYRYMYFVSPENALSRTALLTPGDL